MLGYHIDDKLYRYYWKHWISSIRWNLEITCGQLNLTSNSKLAPGSCPVTRGVGSVCRVQCAKYFKVAGTQRNEYDLRCVLNQDGLTATWSPAVVPYCEGGSLHIICSLRRYSCRTLNQFRTPKSVDKHSLSFHIFSNSLRAEISTKS